MPAKKVVYLLGAGSTIAEAMYAGIPKEEGPSLAYISQNVIRKAKQITKLRSGLKEVSPDETKDIELYISLLESVRVKKYNEIAEEFRSLFCSSIQNSLTSAGKPVIPVLENALLQMHKAIGDEETFAGAISLNYDTLIDAAFCEIFGGIDYGMRCRCDNPKFKIGTDYPKLLKLHGSFNWISSYPSVLVTAEDTEITNQSNMLWVPPSIQKMRDSYPFNLIWGKAFEMLDCDILRIIGCRLSQNDYGLLSLLYSTQLEIEEPYEIQIIDWHEIGLDIKERNAFLRNVKPLGQLENCSEFEYMKSDSLFNPFEGWLGAKLNTIKDLDEMGFGYINLLLGVR